MARAQQDVQSPFTFVKGLITEANRLNEPDNSASDMLNIVVDTTGTAKVRLGLQEEIDFEYVSSLISSLDNAIATIEWKNVNGNPAKNFLVLQIATRLFFFDLAGISVSSSFIGYVDFDSVCVSVSDAALSTTDGRPVALGLVCTNLYADPFLVIYDEEENRFLLSRLTLKTRDFNGVPDGLRVDENPTILSFPHFYNLMNQGWVEPGDSGLLDSTGVGTEGGTPTSGGGSADIGDDFGEVALP